MITGEGLIDHKDAYRNPVEMSKIFDMGREEFEGRSRRRGRYERLVVRLCVSDWGEAARINLTADPIAGAAGHFIYDENSSTARNADMTGCEFCRD